MTLLKRSWYLLHAWMLSDFSCDFHWMLIAMRGLWRFSKGDWRQSEVTRSGDMKRTEALLSTIPQTWTLTMLTKGKETWNLWDKRATSTQLTQIEDGECISAVWLWADNVSHSSSSWRTSCFKLRQEQASHNCIVARPLPRIWITLKCKPVILWQFELSELLIEAKHAWSLVLG